MDSGVNKCTVTRVDDSEHCEIIEQSHITLTRWTTPSADTNPSMLRSKHGTIVMPVPRYVPIATGTPGRQSTDGRDLVEHSQEQYSLPWILEERSDA